jgi:hypothetical protein
LAVPSTRKRTRWTGRISEEERVTKKAVQDVVVFALAEGFDCGCECGSASVEAELTPV